MNFVTYILTGCEIVLINETAMDHHPQSFYRQKDRPGSHFLHGVSGGRGYGHSEGAGGNPHTGEGGEGLCEGVGIHVEHKYDDSYLFASIAPVPLFHYKTHS